jgi:hypothetical protein
MSPYGRCLQCPAGGPPGCPAGRSCSRLAELRAAGDWARLDAYERRVVAHATGQRGGPATPAGPASAEPPAPPGSPGPTASLAGPRAPAQAPPYRGRDEFLAPLRGPGRAGWERNGWTGCARRHPSDYRATAAIVHLDQPALLRSVVETLRLQTERPYILVVDAGSLAVHRAELEAMELASDDLEVAQLNPRGWSCTSEPVAAAMDVAFALCQTEYLYSTHVDVFLKRRDYLAGLLALCDARTPAVGYQMSPRPAWKSYLWRELLSHTASVYHMPTMRKLGARWSMRATFERYGMAMRQPEPDDPIQPDTEVELGLCLRDAGVGVRWPGDPAPAAGGPPSVLMIGTEPNEPYADANLEHVRSFTSYALYHPDGNDPAARRRAIMARALAASAARCAGWRAADATARAAYRPGGR